MRLNVSAPSPGGLGLGGLWGDWGGGRMESRDLTSPPLTRGPEGGGGGPGVMGVGDGWSRET